MAQSEVFELVVVATDKAGSSLERVSKSLDQANFGVVNLDASMRDSVDNLRRLGIVQREVGQAARSVQAPMRELSEGSKGSLKATSVSATTFASKIGSEVFSAITRLGGPILAATASIAAFHKKLVDTKTLNEMARSLGVPVELIKGMRRTATEFSIPTDQIDQALTSLLGKFQDMKVMGKGDLYERLWQVQGGQKLAGRLHSLMGEVGRGEKTEEEGQKEGVLETLKFIREYREAYGEAFTARMLEEVGLDKGLAAFGQLPLEEHKKRLSGFGSGKELDPEQVEKFWTAWREFSRALGNFTTAVLTPLLPKLTEFMARLANDKELQKFADETFPKICEDIEVAYRTLKGLLEGNPIEWDKVFGSHLFKFLEKDLQDFFNQAKRMWEQFKAGIGLGSQADIDAARKEELLYRKGYKTLSETEEQELKGLEAGQPGAAGETKIPRVSSEREQAIIDLMESYRQRQKFADIPEDDEVLRVEIENTRALKDLTEEVKKLNQRFMRAAFPAGTGGADVEGRQQGGPVAAGRSYLVGEGGTPEWFVPRQQGGLVQGVGMRGPQLFTPAQSGAVIANKTQMPKMAGLTPPTAVFPNLPSARSVVRDAPPHGIQSTRSSVYGNLSEREGSAIPGGWVDKGDIYTKGPMKGQPLPQFTGAPRSVPGVSIPFLETAGKAGQQAGAWVRVVNPRTGQPEYVQQVDIGPNMFNPRSQNKGIDINAALAEKWGFVPTESQSKATGKPVFPTGQKIDWQIASQEEVLWSSFPTSDQQKVAEAAAAAPVAFRRGSEAAAEAETHIPPAEQASLEGRQEGGPVGMTDEQIRASRQSNFRMPEESAHTTVGYPDYYADINKLPDYPTTNLEDRRDNEGGVLTQSRRFIENAMHAAKYNARANIRDWKERGFGAPIEGRQESPISIFGERRKTLEPEGQPIKYQPGSLNIIQKDAPGYEATGSLNVNVNGPRGTSVKAEGTGPFETVNMSRRMTDQQQP